MLKKPCTICFEQGFWLRGQGSNLRPPGYEPDELPLLYPAILDCKGTTFFRKCKNNRIFASKLHICYHMSYPKIILKPGKEESLKRFHPWVFSGAINHIEDTNGQSIEEGDKAAVYSSQHEFLGIGHTQAGSIAVRILSFQERPIDEGFYRERLCQAWQLRRNLKLVRPDNTAFRLVHGEGDFLPGLVIDVYGHTAVMQAHSPGMHLDRRMIAEAICHESQGAVKDVYYKSENTLPFKAGLNPKDGYLLHDTILLDEPIGDKAHGQDKDCTGKHPATDAASPGQAALENGILFYPNWIEGQKTGFFIDQRDNRSLVEHYAAGRHVLNMFCYTGGFSLYALRGGAAEVVSVDSSAKAIELARKNVELNFGECPRHQALTDDAFGYLQSMDQHFNLIILDPPAFAKHQKALHQALQGYRRLNALAFKKIAPNGILFTFSCSQAVSREDFRLAIFSAAAQSRRKVRILHQLTQPADHPVNIYHPEGEYLKGLVLAVE